MPSTNPPGPNLPNELGAVTNQLTWIKVLLSQSGACPATSGATTTSPAGHRLLLISMFPQEPEKPEDPRRLGG